MMLLTVKNTATKIMKDIIRGGAVNMTVILVNTSLNCQCIRNMHKNKIMRCLSSNFRSSPMLSRPLIVPHYKLTKDMIESGGPQTPICSLKLDR